jgi:hypothetical protein
MARILNKRRVILDLNSLVVTRSDDMMLSSSQCHLLHTKNWREAMGEGSELRFSAYGALICTWFLPTTSQWWDATVFAKLWQWRRSIASWWWRRTSGEAWHRLGWFLMRFRLRGPSLWQQWGSGQLLRRLAQRWRRWKGGLMVAGCSVHGGGKVLRGSSGGAFL